MVMILNKMREPKPPLINQQYDVCSKSHQCDLCDVEHVGYMSPVYIKALMNTITRRTEIS